MSGAGAGEDLKRLRLARRIDENGIWLGVVLIWLVT
jgi:hypothetical protein